MQKYKEETREVLDRVAAKGDHEQLTSQRAFHAWNQHQGARDRDVYKLDTIFAGSQGKPPGEIVEPLGSITETPYGSMGLDYGMGGSPAAGSTLQPIAGGSMSRTSYAQFFPAGFANRYASENREAEDRLRSVEERIKRGLDNSLLRKQHVA